MVDVCVTVVRVVAVCVVTVVVVSVVTVVVTVDVSPQVSHSTGQSFRNSMATSAKRSTLQMISGNPPQMAGGSSLPSQHFPPSHGFAGVVVVTVVTVCEVTVVVVAVVTVVEVTDVSVIEDVCVVVEGFPPRTPSLQPHRARHSLSIAGVVWQIVGLMFTHKT